MTIHTIHSGLLPHQIPSFQWIHLTHTRRTNVILILATRNFNVASPNNLQYFLLTFRVTHNNLDYHMHRLIVDVFRPNVKFRNSHLSRSLVLISIILTSIPKIVALKDDATFVECVTTMEVIVSSSFEFAKLLHTLI